ncbi:Ribosomal lysine N-methyltransferase set10 [Cytospora mali]|uniref:Ribosomal lysine N-methyltransferase set10 n=1 Tax=Cytospora mali TaxID=578113 RepID=A0A194VUI8_CYTMA|nr:Ribosomal lysine N-methyltransferase set10 [Valsa mali]
MKEVEQERFDTLLSWSKTYGAEIHPALEVYKDEVTGFSMRVKPSPTSTSPIINRGDNILTCPLQTSLSYLNATTGGPLLSRPAERTEPCPVFPERFMKLEPHVIGRFYLMKQYLMGKASFWYPYIATLPQPDVISSWSLPPFWPDEDLAFLDGTNTGVAAEEIRTNIKKEYKEARKILKEEDYENWQDFTRPLYNWAFSIFASRSFRPSLVMPRAVRDMEVPKDVDIDDFSVLLPVYDIINHDIKANVQWLVDHENTAAKVCRFQTLDEYRPGEQVFNTYGKKTNSELLLSYGFVLPEGEDFHNDYFHLRKKTSPPQGGTGGDNTAERVYPQPGKRKPQDFLVSLRPMNYPSSFVGQNRNWVAKDPSLDIRPGFAHVEDNLVWDLCLAIVGGSKDVFIDMILGTTGQEPPLTTNKLREREQNALRNVLSASAELPGQADGVVSQVKEMLLAKLGMEYDKVCETDPGAYVDEEGNEVVVEVEPQTVNQKLALKHREQVKKVLENAIAALVPDWKEDA